MFISFASLLLQFVNWGLSTCFILEHGCDMFKKNWLLRGRTSRGSEEQVQVSILRLYSDPLYQPDGLYLKICDNTIFL